MIYIYFTFYFDSKADILSSSNAIFPLCVDNCSLCVAINFDFACNTDVNIGINED